MATMTVTEAAKAVEVLSLELLCTSTLKKQYEAALERLEKILAKYTSWRDPLSEEIYDWAEEVVAVDLTSSVDILFALEKASELTEKLANKILINTYDNTPFVKPCLEDGRWVWDAWMVEDYQNVAKGKPSPFTKKALNVQPHLFACDMLDWVHTLDPKKIEKLESKSDLSVLASDTANDSERFASYCLWAASVVMERLNSTIDKGAAKMDSLKKATEKVAKKEAERAEAAAKAHLDTVNAKITASEKATEARIGVLETSNKDIDSRLKKETERRNVAEHRVETVEKRNAALVNQVRQLSNEVCNLRNSDSGGGCVIQ